MAGHEAAGGCCMSEVFLRSWLGLLKVCTGSLHVRTLVQAPCASYDWLSCFSLCTSSALQCSIEQDPGVRRVSRSQASPCFLASYAIHLNYLNLKNTSKSLDFPARRRKAGLHSTTRSRSPQAALSIPRRRQHPGTRRAGTGDPCLRSSE